MPPSSTADFRQQIEVETPEHVVVGIEIAGLGSRAIAAIIDIAILAVWTIAYFRVVDAILGKAADSGWTEAILQFVNFVVYWAYFAGFEGLRGGQTPGKRAVGIRVIRDTGHPVTFGAAAIRNLLRLADFLPPPYLTGLLLILLHPRAKRIGDLVAGTVVARDRPAVLDARAMSPRAVETVVTGAPELVDDEFRLLREFIERSTTLDAAARRRLGARMAERFATRYPNRPADPLTFLSQLHASELERRQGRFAAAGRSGAGLAERFVAQKQERWEHFQRLATRAASQGLDSFSASELPEFAARYRELAADLARARTYGAPPAIVFQLERLVTAGHNALYRDERRSLRRIGQILLRECPAAVIKARAYVLAAMLAFAVPGVGGYLLLRERPGLAAELLPDVMLLRAEQAKDEMAHGRSYAEADAKERPVMASFIIRNNIRVAFYCFATGVFLGFGSLVALAFNGLLFGTVLGHFENMDVLRYILAFVMGHGVLELFAIWVAGGAGFLLGLSIIAPGRMTRSDALVVNGRIAFRMIGAVVVLLLVAGLIEGFVSAGEGGFGFRVAVSGASALFLILYLLNGARYLRRT